jgi:hypothetical protein
VATSSQFPLPGSYASVRFFKNFLCSLGIGILIASKENLAMILKARVLQTVHIASIEILRNQFLYIYLPFFPLSLLQSYWPSNLMPELDD